MAHIVLLLRQQTVQILYFLQLPLPAGDTAHLDKALLRRLQVVLAAAAGVTALVVRLESLDKEIQGVIAIAIQQAQAAAARLLVVKMQVREKLEAQDHHLQFLAHL